MGTWLNQTDLDMKTLTPEWLADVSGDPNPLTGSDTVGLLFVAQSFAVLAKSAASRTRLRAFSERCEESASRFCFSERA